MAERSREPPVRIELTTYRLQGGCSTTELQGRICISLGGGWLRSAVPITLSPASP